MKPRPAVSAPDRVRMDMTPMIDVCFQLIIFFMLSLRLFSPEGDFTITMPMSSASAALASPDLIPVMKVRLRAGADGELAAIQLGDRVLGKDAVQEIQRIGAAIRAAAAAAAAATDPNERQKRLADLEALQTRRAEASARAFRPLRQEVRRIVGDQAGPGSVEASELELECDYHLKYVYVMGTVTAASGYLDGSQVKPMVGKIKFAPPRKL